MILKKKKLTLSTYVMPNCRRPQFHTKQILISNVLFGDCSMMYKEGYFKCSNKILIFKIPVIFEDQNFAARSLLNF